MAKNPVGLGRSNSFRCFAAKRLEALGWCNPTPYQYISVFVSYPSMFHGELSSLLWITDVFNMVDIKKLTALAIDEQLQFFNYLQAINYS